jgi:hypothetical protein
MAGSGDARLQQPGIGTVGPLVEALFASQRESIETGQPRRLTRGAQIVHRDRAAKSAPLAAALEWAQVRTLAADGLSQREFARRLQINRRRCTDAGERGAAALPARTGRLAGGSLRAGAAAAGSSGRRSRRRGRPRCCASTTRVAPSTSSAGGCAACASRRSGWPSGPATCRGRECKHPVAPLERARESHTDGPLAGEEPRLPGGERENCLQISHFCRRCGIRTAWLETVGRLRPARQQKMLYAGSFLRERRDANPRPPA